MRLFLLSDLLFKLDEASGNFSQHLDFHTPSYQSSYTLSLFNNGLSIFARDVGLIKFEKNGLGLLDLGSGIFFPSSYGKSGSFLSAKMKSHFPHEIFQPIK